METDPLLRGSTTWTGPQAHLYSLEFLVSRLPLATGYVFNEGHTDTSALFKEVLVSLHEVPTMYAISTARATTYVGAVMVGVAHEYDQAVCTAGVDEHVDLGLVQLSHG